jgi:hypothetical protein
MRAVLEQVRIKELKAGDLALRDGSLPRSLYGLHATLMGLDGAELPEWVQEEFCQRIIVER